MRTIGKTIHLADYEFLDKQTKSYKITELKGPYEGYHDGNRKGNYQVVVSCDCTYSKLYEGQGRTSGPNLYVVYLDHNARGWSVVSVGSGP